MFSISGRPSDDRLSLFYDLVECLNTCNVAKGIHIGIMNMYQSDSKINIIKYPDLHAHVSDCCPFGLHVVINKKLS